MNTNKDQPITELRPIVNNLIRYTETAQIGLFLQCYANIPEFLAISGDGIIRNYEAFKDISIAYYSSLKEQKLITLHEIYHVLDAATVIVCWSGNIDAFFKNGDSWKMENYTVTFLFKKINGEWKIIHSHESALAPMVVKAK